MVGASLTAVTNRLNDAEVLELPSLTVMITVALPNWLAPGVMVTVRLAPLPPKEILATGINAVLLDEAESVRLATGVSVSPTVKGMAAVGVFSNVD